MFSFRTCGLFLAVILSLVADIQGQLSGFPSLRDVVTSALHIYGDVDDLMDSHVFYPDLRFSCSGNITKINFIGERRQPVKEVMKYLRFSVWSTKANDTDFKLEKVPKKSLGFQLNHSRILLDGSNNIYLYQIKLRENETFLFEDGDIFGIRQSDANRSKVALLHQVGGGNSYKIELRSGVYHMRSFVKSVLEKSKVVPMIAIETDQNSSCTQGFLNKKTLETIVNSSLLQYNQTPKFERLNDTGHVHIVTNMTITSSGLLTKWIFAAKFNNEVKAENWPELQIWRQYQHESTRYNKVAGTSMKPIHTEHLNVFEYDLSNDPIKVESGDIFGVYQPGTEAQYSVQFLAVNYSGAAAPINYIINAVNPEDIDITERQEERSLVPLVFAEIKAAEPTLTYTTTESQPSTITSRPVPKSDDPVGDDTYLQVVIVAVACAGALLFLMVVVALAILVVMIRKAKVGKKVVMSGNTSPIDNPAYIINDERKSRYYLTRGDSADRSVGFTDSFEDTVSETYHFYHCLNPPDSNEGLPDYSEVGPTDVTIYATPEGSSPTQPRLPDVVVVEAAPDGSVEASNNPPSIDTLTQSFIVPAGERRATLDYERTDLSACYPLLGNEGLYSGVEEVGDSDQSPFFEETESFWAPARDCASLYQQLANRKYREVLRNQIELKKTIGSGQFGTVMKGVWFLPGSPRDVAVKTLKEGSSEEDKVKFLQEAAINGQFWHPNIVRLMGVVTVGEPVMMILELLVNGDLRNYLCKKVSNDISLDTPQTLLRFCKEISSGMKYLSDKNFIHRDLAARNILVSEETTCKISDFGMSRDLEDTNYYVSQGGKVPVKWTAPEAMHYMKYSTASDVWSFGCVMFEIWTLGKKPFENYSNPETVRMVDLGYRLPSPPGCPQELYRIMIQCWHPHKAQRPTFQQLHKILSDFPLSSTEIQLLGMPLESTNTDEVSSSLQSTYATNTPYEYRP